MTEQLARYEAWAREIEVRQATLARTRGAWMRAFKIIALVSPVGFFWDPWMGGATTFTGVMSAAFGAYTVVVRESEYRRELAQLKKDMDRLKGE